MSLTDPRPERFQLRTRRSGDLLVVTIVGEVDAAERDQIIGALDAGERPTSIIFDLAELRFMGSAGIAALVHALHLVEPTSGAVELVDPSRSVLVLIDVCGLAGHFKIRRSDESS